jgi:hypothetical protein
MNRLRPSAPALVDIAALIVLGVLALLGFRNTYAGWSYLIIGGTGLLIGLAVSYLLRALRQPVIVVAAAVMIAFLIFGELLILPGQSMLSVETAHQLSVSAVYGWKQLLTTLPPVAVGDPLVIVPFILGLVCGCGGYLLAQALPAPARPTGLRALAHTTAPVVVPIIVLAATIAFGTDVPGAELPDGIAFAVLSLCWIAIRRSRTRPLAAGRTRRVSRFATAASLLSAAALGAALLGPVLPGAHVAGRTVLRDQVVPPFDVNEYPSPLVGFRKYTKAANQLYDQTLFTVRGLPPGATVRIASLDDYDGLVWKAAGGAPGDEFQRVGTHIAASNGSTVTVHVTIAAGYASQPDLSAWLPAAGTVADVFLGTIPGASTLHFNRGAQDGVLTGRLRTGDTYSFDTVLTSPTMPADAQPYGEPLLSENAQSLLGAHIATWTSGETGLAAQLKAVATFLRNTGAYSDGGVNETQFLPGHSLGRLSSFVNGPQPVGDDEQYAAVYALAANNLGIPARVVFGARPEADGSVRGQDVHAWVEVHVADGSWVPIPESTFMPDQSKKPDQQPPQETQNVNAAVVPPPNAIHRPTSSTDQQSNETVLPPKRPGKPSLLSRIWAVVEPIAIWAGPPILLIVLLAGGLTGWKWRRRRQRRTAGTTANRYAGGWRELVDLARDAGLAVPSGQTRQQQADLLLGIGNEPVAARRTGRHRGRGWLPFGLGRSAEPEFADTIRVDPPLSPVFRPLRGAYGAEAEAAVRALADAADVAIYGPLDPTDEEARAFWDGIESTRRNMIKRYARRRRIAVHLSLGSLRPQPAPTRL